MTLYPETSGWGMMSANQNEVFMRELNVTLAVVWFVRWMLKIPYFKQFYIFYIHIQEIFLLSREEITEVRENQHGSQAGEWGDTLSSIISWSDHAGT